MIRFAAAVLLCFAFAGTALAHPLPNLRHDRVISVRLTPATVTVVYSLEINLFTMLLDGRTLFTPEEIAGIQGDRGYAVLYATKMGPIIGDNLRATLDGQPLTFRLEKQDLDLSHNLGSRYVFVADWSPPPGKRAAFEFEDFNFPDKTGTLNLSFEKASPDPNLAVHDSREPSAELRNRPSIDLKPGEADQLRKLSATIERKAAEPPQDATPKTEAPRVSAPALTLHEDEKPSLTASLWNRGLVALFDTGYGLGALLLGAFLFGAAHAFTPGHGKTLVAVYLVGERGTVTHAILLAVATTVAHTGSVIAIAALLWSAYGNNVPGATQGVLQFLGGLLIAGVGLWLLLRRLTGKADHFHLFAGHHHHHADGMHDHSHGHGHHHHEPLAKDAKSTAGWARLVLMGLGGGLIPCWDAVLLLIAAMSFNRLGFAIPLLFAFSFGLGAVLVALGVGVVYAHRAGASRFKESRWFRLLPTVSALLLVLMGFWLCQEGIALAGRG